MECNSLWISGFQFIYNTNNSILMEDNLHNVITFTIREKKINVSR